MQGTLKRVAGIYPKPNLIANGTFTSDIRAWSGTSWSFSGGTALHAAGSTAVMVQTVSKLLPGKRYRVSFTVTGRTAGGVIPRLSGGTAVTGTTVSANGDFTEVLTAAQGNTSFDFAPGSTFDGAIDNVELRRV